MSRVRIRDYVGTTGGRAIRYTLGQLVYDATQDNVGSPAYRAYCDDVIGNPGGFNPLLIEKTKQTVVPLNGKIESGGGNSKEYINWVATLQKNSPNHISLTTESDAVSATKVLARTNPNRPEINLPVSVLELRDLPRMIKLAGDTILKRGAGAYLSWSFGWKPLISDIRKLLDFHALTDKRAKEILKLYDKGGLRRRLKLDKQNKEDSSIVNIESLMSELVRVKQARHTSLSRWGTVRWTPTALPPTDETELRELAQRLVLDTQLSMSNLWNAMPWTWLIDWFVNVGDFIDANGNTIPVSASPVCIMTHRETKVSWKPRTDSLIFTGGTGVAERHSKIRHVVSGASLATTPYLGPRQLSILAALFITRHKPSGGL